MVKQITAFQSETSERIYPSWVAAAADEIEAAMRLILPADVIADEQQRELAARRMSEALLVEQDEKVLTAWGAIFQSMQSEPQANVLELNPKHAKPRSWRSLLNGVPRTGEGGA